MSVYRLTDPQLLDSIENHSGGVIGSLKQEVILLRALIEDRLSLNSTPAEKIVAFSSVTSALATLAKLVETLHKIEVANKTLLPEAELHKFVEAVVAVLAEELPSDSDLIDRIISRIAEIKA